jgi:hypothetical protein
MPTRCQTLDATKKLAKQDLHDCKSKAKSKAQKKKKKKKKKKKDEKKKKKDVDAMKKITNPVRIADGCCD